MQDRPMTVRVLFVRHCPLSHFQSTRLNVLLKPMSQLRFDCDTTTIRLRRKIEMFMFLLASNRIEWKQARAIRHIVGS